MEYAKSISLITERVHGKFRNRRNKRVYSFLGGFGCLHFLTMTLSPVPFSRLFICLASTFSISMSFLPCICLRTSNFTFPRAKSVIFWSVCRYFSSLPFHLPCLSHSIGRILGFCFSGKSFSPIYAFKHVRAMIVIDVVSVFASACSTGSPFG